MGGAWRLTQPQPPVLPLRKQTEQSLVQGFRNGILTPPPSHPKLNNQQPARCYEENESKKPHRYRQRKKKIKRVSRSQPQPLSILQNAVKHAHPPPTPEQILGKSRPKHATGVVFPPGPLLRGIRKQEASPISIFQPYTQPLQHMKKNKRNGGKNRKL